MLTIDIDKHAFRVTPVAAMTYRSDTFLHVQVVDDQTSLTEGTIHHTTDNEKHFTRMMFTSSLLRHPTLKLFLIRIQKGRTGSASPRLNGEAGCT